MEIVLVRHGETEWSLSGQHTSHTDLPLTEKGRERAVRLGPALADWTFSLVLSSPLRRARETCELAGYAEAASLCEDLHEWDYGEYEGLTTPQIWETDPSWSLWRDGCPGGEQPAEVGARADRVIERMRAADGDCLAFAHGHILRVLTARWLQMDVSGGARFALSAGTVSALGFERTTEVVRLWNKEP
ncbi:MAG TPA: histidine phosphatase family protein [Solirubrobacteraceae bacterium]|jgi:probable phosphoglycerate mutase|nr:histidine phosphatase family protein [Solirubrobacteraceae bacterium]HEX4279280.1 histidine phosphatase family protein [Solirubrobacteraceae bacterium]